MKRIVSFLIALFCFFSICTYGWASNDSSSQSSDINIDGVKPNSKIQFRDIPFGTSYSEVVAALEKEGFSIPEVGWADNGLYYLTFDSVPVAGLKMRMTLDFICPDRENYYDAKAEDCVFFRAEYSLGNNSVARVLHEKLCVVYGDRPFVHDSGYFCSEDNANWVDNDVTINLHSKENYKQEAGPVIVVSSSVSITYAWSDAEKLEEQYKKENNKRFREEQEKKHKQEIQNSDKTGL